MTVTEREFPILFNAEMVRAILDGRKTQTRRPLTSAPGPAPYDSFHFDAHADRWFAWHEETERCVGPAVVSPFGKAGDHLWVRESYRLPGPPSSQSGRGGFDNMSPTEALAACAGVPTRWYEPDGSNLNSSAGFIGVPGKLRPSIHMPRWASRISLLVKSVRLERLRPIRRADRIAEGFSHISEFRHAWESIYGMEGPARYAANPWVWVCEFERIEA